MESPILVKQAAAIWSLPAAPCFRPSRSDSQLERQKRITTMSDTPESGLIPRSRRGIRIVRQSHVLSEHGKPQYTTKWRGVAPQPSNQSRRITEDLCQAESSYPA